MTKEALTDLQLALMKALWSIGEGTVSDVLDALAKDGRTLAPTTVATLLQRLYKQGWVATRKSGRLLIYRAQVDQQTAASGALRRVLGAFFGGSISAAAAQLMAAEELTPEELAQMRGLVAKKRG